MTTIAFRDGELAADSGVTVGGSTLAQATKIARNPNGDLAGCAGTATFMRAYLEWFGRGEFGDMPEPVKDEDILDRAIVFRKSGQIEVYEAGGYFTLRAPYYAIGSGRCEALGAFYAGADAQTAVEAARYLDASTFGDIIVLRFTDE